MPSLVLGQPFLSGVQILISGNPWSGSVPNGGVRITVDTSASGSIYLGYSGNVTLFSGGMLLSGGGSVTDGTQIKPGATYHVARSKMPISGTYNLYAWCDTACSGQVRVYVDPLF